MLLILLHSICDIDNSDRSIDDSDDDDDDDDIPFPGIVVGLIAVRWLRTANRPLKDIDIIVQIGTG
jgi:hypothetical protein